MTEAKLADYRLFPYEIELAKREFEALTGVHPTPTTHGLNAAGECGEAFTLLVNRSTYFSRISAGSREQETFQAQIEDRHWRLRSGGGRRKQATRYGVHGIHEYRGKFNPQMARALINVVDSEATHLLDPFCGSGTTLVEGARLGMSVAGIDMSPMAHFLARTKIDTYAHRDLPRLTSDFGRLRVRVRDAMKVGQERDQSDPPPWIDSVAVEYLTEWFTRPALSALFAGLSELEPPGSDDLCSDLLAVCISSIVRPVSLQLPEDLRVRRRPPGFVAPQLAELFDEAADRVEAGLEDLQSRTRLLPVKYKVLHGSSSDTELLLSLTQTPARRLIVTSPPYATALPYIDTDRLSLLLLGLLRPADLRGVESSLVGSREWNRSEAKAWAIRRADNTAGLPSDVLKLLDRIDARNKALGAGFRRAAVPDLLYRYFAAIADCFKAWTSYLRPGERAVLVVGRNRTGRRGEEIVVDTPALLAAVATSRGFAELDRIPFETWPRYGLHSANGVAAEDAVLLTRCA